QLRATSLIPECYRRHLVRSERHFLLRDRTATGVNAREHALSPENSGSTASPRRWNGYKKSACYTATATRSCAVSHHNENKRNRNRTGTARTQTLPRRETNRLRRSRTI